MDEWGISPYYGNTFQKKVTYTGKIHYNQSPKIVSYDGSIDLAERFFYLKDVKKLSAEELQERLLRAVKGVDKEDEEFQQAKDNYLYQGRLREEPELKILGKEELLKNLILWIEKEEEDRELEKICSYMISYRDIFGKQVKKEALIHVIDGEQLVKEEQQKEKVRIRFISKEYIQTIENESKWNQQEEYRKLLEAVLQNDMKGAEVYEVEKGQVFSKDDVTE